MSVQAQGQITERSKTLKTIILASFHGTIDASNISVLEVLYKIGKKDVPSIISNINGTEEEHDTLVEAIQRL